MLHRKVIKINTSGSSLTTRDTMDSNITCWYIILWLIYQQTVYELQKNIRPSGISKVIGVQLQYLIRCIIKFSEWKEGILNKTATMDT